MINKFIKVLNDKDKPMVLSTCDMDGHISSRFMCVFHIDECLYFQTDTSMRKYSQMKDNNNVAICVDNLQIEGVCEELGHPHDEENKEVLEKFKMIYPSSFEKYSSIPEEKFFRIRPTYAQMWI